MWTMQFILLFEDSDDTSFPSILLSASFSLCAMFSKKHLNNDTFVYMKPTCSCFGFKRIIISLKKFPSICALVRVYFIHLLGLISWYNFVLTPTAIIFNYLLIIFSILIIGLNVKYHNQSYKSHLPIGVFAIVSFV